MAPASSPSGLPAATLAFDLSAASASGAPDGQRRVRLLPIGVHKTRNGSPPQIIVEDRAHAEAIATATLDRLGETELFFDYDHQAVSAMASNGRAPAAGWAKRIFGDNQGVWADVEFTAAAAAAIDAREYRYVSPFFQHKRADGRVTCIINAGLTNTPNLELGVDLSAVASALLPTVPGDVMNYIEIAKALGLGEDATLEAILQAITAMQPAVAVMSAMPKIAQAVGLAEDASADAVLSAASALKAGAGAVDPAKFVPVEQVVALNTRLTALEGDRIEAAVASAIEGGKIVPALKDWATNLAKSDPTAFASYVSAAPTLLADGGTVRTAAPQGGKDTLSDADRAAASALGLTDEDYLAAKKEG